MVNTLQIKLSDHSTKVNKTFQQTAFRHKNDIMNPRTFQEDAKLNKTNFKER